MMRVYITQSNLNYINMYFKISKHDAEYTMTPQEALENFATTDEKVLAAYQLGLAIGAAKGSFGPPPNYMPDVSGY